MYGTCQAFSEFIFTRLHINTNTDFVLDLSELTSVSFTKSLLKLQKLMTDRYKITYSYIQNKGQCKEKSTSQKIHNDCKTPYITFILICCRLNLIYCSYVCIVLTPPDQ